MGKIHFDVVLGNPPYQEETSGKDIKSNRQTPVKNIFQYFQEAADNIAQEATVMIYPGGRWIHQFGKGLKDFGKHQIHDPHLKTVYFYADASEVFPNVQIADGITVVIKDKRKTETGFDYVYVEKGNETKIHVIPSEDNLMPLDPRDIKICEKLDAVVRSFKLKYMHEGILPRSLFQIESSFVENHPDAVTPCHKNDAVLEATKVKLFTNDKAGKMGRARWYFVDRAMIKANQEYISQWQVVVSSANAGGQKRDSHMEIIDNQSAFGRSRVALKSFKNQREAENFFKYTSSYLVRYAFLMTDESLSSLGKRVPDFLNYTDANPYLDFHKPLDSQLYNIFALTEEEQRYIEMRVDTIRRSVTENHVGGKL